MGNLLKLAEAKVTRATKTAEKAMKAFVEAHAGLTKANEHLKAAIKHHDENIKKLTDELNATGAAKHVAMTQIQQNTATANKIAQFLPGETK